MTAKARAIIDNFESNRFALRDRVVARLRTISTADRTKILISAGILTKRGKLARGYRP
jgi:hypothetical protein